MYSSKSDDAQYLCFDKKMKRFPHVFLSKKKKKKKKKRKEKTLLSFSKKKEKMENMKPHKR
jgi:hypothetical protein